MTRLSSMFRGHWAIALMVVPSFAGCAAALGRRHVPRSGDYDILTRQQLASVAGTIQNAYSAVEKLRPLFLATRPGSSMLRGSQPRIHVFLNGGYAGDADVLKTMPLASIESIRFVPATVAFTQYGEIHSGDGVLMVRLRGLRSN